MENNGGWHVFKLMLATRKCTLPQTASTDCYFYVSSWVFLYDKKDGLEGCKAVKLSQCCHVFHCMDCIGLMLWGFSKSELKHWYSGFISASSRFEVCVLRNCEGFSMTFRFSYRIKMRALQGRILFFFQGKDCHCTFVSGSLWHERSHTSHIPHTYHLSLSSSLFLTQMHIYTDIHTHSSRKILSAPQ